jgi:uncharacterized membrane protein
VSKTRLEAFSDAVIAIVMTIMVLELRLPHGSDWAALRTITPVFLAYVLSFTFLGIYWNNHHHLLHAAHRVNGRILWANLHLLFWLSLVPFATHWWGEHPDAPLPTAGYGVVFIGAAIAWIVLQTEIVRHHGPDSKLAQALGSDLKGKLSLSLYAAGLILSFVRPWLAMTAYAVVAAIWFVPDRRIESRVAP